jgi:hypothetical protein
MLGDDAPAVFQFQLVAKNLEFFEHVIDPEEVVTWKVGSYAPTDEVVVIHQSVRAMSFE